MRKVMIAPKLGKKGKVPSTIIKRAAMKIRYKSKQKYYHNYNEVVEHEGARIFLVYQFHHDDITFIKQARYVKR